MHKITQNNTKFTFSVLARCIMLNYEFKKNKNEFYVEVQNEKNRG